MTIAVALILFLLLLPSYRAVAVEIISIQVETMLIVIPPIFILIGFLDVWIIPKLYELKFEQDTDRLEVLAIETLLQEDPPLG